MAQMATTERARSYGAGIFTGTKVRLRPATDEDYPILDGWWQDIEWMPLQQGPVHPRPAGPAAEQFAKWSANDTYGNVGLVIEAIDELQTVGHITIHSATLANRAGTLGIIVGPDHVGRGYGSDAVRVMLRYAFEEMNLNRVELQVFAYNDQAIRAYERCGFVTEGRRREVVFHAGTYHDSVIMSVLASEWSATTPPAPHR